MTVNSKRKTQNPELQSCPWPIPPLVDGDDDIVWLAWIKELPERDIERIFRSTRTGDDPSTRMIYELCGLEVYLHLAKSLISTPLYISEAPINEARKLFIRTFYNPDQPETSVKVLSVRLRVSTQFVRDTLADDTKEDSRQLDAFKEKA